MNGRSGVAEEKRGDGSGYTSAPATRESSLQRCTLGPSPSRGRCRRPLANRPPPSVSPRPSGQCGVPGLSSAPACYNVPVGREAPTPGP
jgi:hypothetical protein